MNLREKGSDINNAIMPKIAFLAINNDKVLINFSETKITIKTQIA